ncbi:hypothetical protein OP10G_4392 [Fimbriimonas ginsengisoli Gsoil 348]|uniref:Uncharacterized protein n=1 Tax=Fimbriimonas ginsengisoli Gsoil 348 TaxID=661478 RepID=A0A068NY15_FIMGI|nr:hypothetical protein OP10G_4392 [Fimbriimonas ginsengisoli Gsoil 348]
MIGVATIGVFALGWTCVSGPSPERAVRDLISAELAGDAEPIWASLQDDERTYYGLDHDRFCQFVVSYLRPRMKRLQQEGQITVSSVAGTKGARGSVHVIMPDGERTLLRGEVVPRSGGFVSTEPFSALLLMAALSSTPRIAGELHAERTYRCLKAEQANLEAYGITGIYSEQYGLESWDATLKRQAVRVSIQQARQSNAANRSR